MDSLTVVSKSLIASKKLATSVDGLRESMKPVVEISKHETRWGGQSLLVSMIDVLETNAKQVQWFHMPEAAHLTWMSWVVEHSFKLLFFMIMLLFVCKLICITPYSDMYDVTAYPWSLLCMCDADLSKLITLLFSIISFTMDFSGCKQCKFCVFTNIMDSL